MRLRLLTACALAIACAACATPTGSAATTTAPHSDAADAKAGGGDTAGDSAEVSTDTEAGETAAGDTGESDVAVVDIGDSAARADGSDAGSDGAIADVKVDAADGVADAKPDAQPDVKPDGGADVKPPTPVKCSKDSDCPKGFGDCLASYCDAASGKCLNKLAADGAACTLGGACGGQGSCKSGACNAPSACAPAACAPQPLKCGDSVTIDVAKLPASTIGAWPCASGSWGGGEAFYTLSSDATLAAAVSLTGAGSSTAMIAVIAPPVASKCAPTSCLVGGDKVVVGVGPGVVQTLAIDVTGVTGTLTLSVSCTGQSACGDGQCSSGETCSGCPKDCGPCKTCGDSKCDAKTENCGSCPADCGDCPPDPPECKTKETPGCPGCACEACVCKADKFCCENAWDGLCVDQCTADCGGPKCTGGTVQWCGDGKCGPVETFATCPQDCPAAAKCGDGWCAAAAGETCSACPIDCGVCKPTSGGPATPVCGDGACGGLEHCGVCPADCGVCSTDCNGYTPTNGPTCLGCACEAEVCKADPYCCSTKWDSICASACEKLAPSKCPKHQCGDGVCSGSENCTTCAKDCGACVCGDGFCTGSESMATCPGDCPPGCKGKCGSSSQSADGKTCWCDEICEQQKDCCSDKKQYCP